MEEQENYYTYENKSSDYVSEENSGSEYNYEDNFKPKRNPVFGIISLVCGIVSLVLGVICCCISPIIAIPIAIIFAIGGIAMFIVDKKVNGSVSPLAIIGLIASIVSLAIAILFAVVYIIYLVFLGAAMTMPSIFNI